MNNVGEKYLPIGTVVMLKGGSKRVMITGFCSIAAEDESKMYDYSGCMYPEGFLSSDETALFNHDQIDKIYHMGLIDDEENKFKVALKTLVNQMDKSGVNTTANSATNNDVPPVGPGLPGSTSQEVASPANEEKKEAPVPPIGPGLPGYVAPQTTTDTTIESI